MNKKVFRNLKTRFPSFTCYLLILFVLRNKHFIDISHMDIKLNTTMYSKIAKQFKYIINDRNRYLIVFQSPAT